MKSIGLVVLLIFLLINLPKFNSLYTGMEVTTKKTFLITTRIILHSLLLVILIAEKELLYKIGYYIWKNKYFSYFFVNGKNFNWIGITSILAIITLTYTALDNRKKLKADLVAKSRVKWLEEARAISARVVKTQRVSLGIFRTINRDIENHGSVNKEFYEKLIEIYDGETIKGEEARSLFEMYFNNGNGKKKKLVEMLDNIMEHRQEKFDYLVYKKSNKKIDESDIEELDNEIKYFVESLTEYFKEEWEKAKSGN